MTATITARRHKTHWPTQKWIATQVTAVAALLVAVINAGDWNKTPSIALIGLLSQAIIGYLVPNADTPGGVPTAEDRAGRHLAE